MGWIAGRHPNYATRAQQKLQMQLVECNYIIIKKTGGLRYRPTFNWTSPGGTSGVEWCKGAIDRQLLKATDGPEVWWFDDRAVGASRHRVPAATVTARRGQRSDDRGHRSTNDGRTGLPSGSSVHLFPTELGSPSEDWSDWNTTGQRAVGLPARQLWRAGKRPATRAIARCRIPWFALRGPDLRPDRNLALRTSLHFPAKDKDDARTKEAISHEVEASEDRQTSAAAVATRSPWRHHRFDERPPRARCVVACGRVLLAYGPPCMLSSPTVMPGRRVSHLALTSPGSTSRRHDAVHYIGRVHSGRTLHM